jgi:hypothetical protein
MPPDRMEPIVNIIKISVWTGNGFSIAIVNF